MDTLHAMRQTVISGFLALPLLLVAITGLFGLGLGNMGMTALFIGQTVFLPIVVSSIQYIIEKSDPADKSTLFVPATDITQLVPSSPISSSSPYQVVAPSYWMTHIFLFLGYVMANAADVYRLPSDPRENKVYVENRKSKAIAIMVIVSIATVIIPILRYSTTKAGETVTGIIISAVVGGALAAATYYFAAFCGARHADMLTISQQMLSQDARASRQFTCFQGGARS